MIELLKPIFKGPLAAYGEGLICSDAHPASAIRLVDLLGAPDALNALLCRQALLLETADLRPVASSWMLKYANLLLPPIVVAATLLKHAFPIDAIEVSIDLDGEENPRKVFISHLGSSAIEQDTASRYAPLIDAHLTPLVMRLSEVSNLPAKILWGNVARRLDTILNQAAAMAPTASLVTDINTDRDYLLQQKIWPDGRRNPLFSRQQTALVTRPDGQQIPTMLHRQCCLLYLLPREGYCVACPLSPRYRLAEPEHFAPD
jgi:ferric iron reductase protein FhuF